MGYSVNSDVSEICATAKALSRNPLGIIALFIVLVYGFASLVTGFSSSFSHEERVPLIYFLVSFPILVLFVFAWLVSCHSSRLFAPADFKNEENYIKMQVSAGVSLATAASKATTGSDINIDRILEIVRQATQQSLVSQEEWKNQILWVDDRPENNVYERQAFEAVGLNFSLALSTDEAFSLLSQRKFAAIISDMGRREGPREGYKLLDRLRAGGDKTPLFFYAASSRPEHLKETEEHGGQGCTSSAQELFEMVTRAVISRV